MKKWQLSMAACCLVVSCQLHSEPFPLNQYNALQILANFHVSTAELPVSLPENPVTLNGEDLNDNQIRDDFERALLEQYSQPEYVALALLAAQQWKTLLRGNRIDSDKPFSPYFAITLLQQLEAIDTCYTNLTKTHPNLISPQQFYFNSAVRKQQQTKQLAELKSTAAKLPSLYQYGQSQRKARPCYVFGELLDVVLPTEYEELDTARSSPKVIQRL
ncbi:hypothetical protein [Photobacterium aquae]|uniref:hypothetical protein n=1 Tax=Photobacterium aquae TaxID=1195763 RepID=UPI00069F3E87|nr:hypothetical protein [Photobacterium aquae]